MSAVRIFTSAERAYFLGDISGALKLYAKAVRKIIADEDVTQLYPYPPGGAATIVCKLQNDLVILLTQYPAHRFARELIGIVWRNLCGFFKDHSLRLNETTAPDAYKLMASFKISKEQHPSYSAFAERGAQGLIILKAMQIAATNAMALMAWDRNDRATAAKRYEDVLALAETYPPFTVNPRPGLEEWIYADLRDTRGNLKNMIATDTMNAAALRNERIGRKETRELVVPHTRIEPDGSVTVDNELTFATDACYACGKRGAKLSKCARCRKATYCGRECQSAHWPTHKGPCKTATS